MVVGYQLPAVFHHAVPWCWYLYYRPTLFLLFCFLCLTTIAARCFTLSIVSCGLQFFNGSRNALTLLYLGSGIAQLTVIGRSA